MPLLRHPALIDTVRRSTRSCLPERTQGFRGLIQSRGVTGAKSRQIGVGSCPQVVVATRVVPNRSLICLRGGRTMFWRDARRRPDRAGRRPSSRWNRLPTGGAVAPRPLLGTCRRRFERGPGTGEGSKFSLESLDARCPLKIAEQFLRINDGRAHRGAHKRVDMDTAIHCFGLSEFGMTAFLLFLDTRLANPPLSSACSLFSQNRFAQLLRMGSASMLRLRPTWPRPRDRDLTSLS